MGSDNAKQRSIACGCTPIFYSLRKGMFNLATLSIGVLDLLQK
jgi:hypothetical protein